MIVHRHQLGQAAEDRATQHLEQAGYRILLRNFRCRRGEIDIVAQRARLLVLAEVRLRTRADYGGAAASITHRKRQRIINTARYLLCREPTLRRLTVRFDTLLLNSVEGEIDWIEDAFR
jgi:putative endonuclease